MAKVKYICEHCDKRQSHEPDEWMYCKHCGRVTGLIKYDDFIKGLIKEHGPALRKELARGNKATV